MWVSVSEDGSAAKAFMRRMVAYFGPYLDPRALALAGVSREDFTVI